MVGPGAPPRFVRPVEGAPHIPARYARETAVVLEEATFSGQPWLRLRFADGFELWTTEARTEAA